MKYRTFLLSALLPMVLLMQPATSHHSVFAEFDVMKSGTIEGVITEVWFKMPHVRYFVVVTDELGEEVTWNIHGHQPRYSDAQWLVRRFRQGRRSSYCHWRSYP